MKCASESFVNVGHSLVHLSQSLNKTKQERKLSQWVNVYLNNPLLFMNIILIITSKGQWGSNYCIFFVEIGETEAQRAKMT